MESDSRRAPSRERSRSHRRAGRIKGEALVCFCVLKKGGGGAVDSDAVAASAKEALAQRRQKTKSQPSSAKRSGRKNASIFVVATSRRRETQESCDAIVRAAYVGEKLGDTSALENPGSLEEIQRVASEERPELTDPPAELCSIFSVFAVILRGMNLPCVALFGSISCRDCIQRILGLNKIGLANMWTRIS